MNFRPVKDLKPAPYNPRKIDPKELKKLTASIKEFGFVEPVVINEDLTVIGGHQRLKAAEKLGMTEVPVIEVSLPKGRERALNLALNRISGEFDQEMLARLLAEMSDEDKALSGFDEDEVLQALGRALKGEEDDFDTTPPKEPKSKLGDLYALGEHRLLCGDATKREDLERLMGGCKLIWFSPTLRTIRG